jgi:hypothetical protein
VLSLVAQMGLIILARVADPVPNFNLQPVCQIAERVTADQYRRDCLRKEREALQELKTKWSGFPAQDRSYCTQLASLAGMPSYVALLTCLEIKSAARPARGAGERSDRGETAATSRSRE